jgi:hypothetical protein
MVVYARFGARTSGALQVWLGSLIAMYLGGIYLFVVFQDASKDPTPFFERLFPSGIPRVTSTKVFVLVAILSLGVMLNFWSDAHEDGEDLLGGTPPSKALAGVLTYQVFPTKLLQTGTDTLMLCDGKHEFYLVGRSDDRSYIISLPTDRSTNGDVLVITLDDYVPVTGIQSPGSCAKVGVTTGNSKP